MTGRRVARLRLNSYVKCTYSLRMTSGTKPATLHFVAQPRTIVGDLRDESGVLLSSVQGATYGEVAQNATARACAMGYRIVSQLEAPSMMRGAVR